MLKTRKRASNAKPNGTLDSAFDALWHVYPRKAAKQAARTSWERAIKRIGGPPAEAVAALQAACEAFAASDKGRGDFCPHPTTWLNQGRWEDDPAVWSERHGPQVPTAADFVGHNFYGPPPE